MVGTENSNCINNCSLFVGKKTTMADFDKVVLASIQLTHKFMDNRLDI